MDFWDRFAGVYDLAESINGSVYTEMCDITRRLVPAGAKVLDCGAGTGELSLAASDNADSVLCTDLSKNMLKQAQRTAKALGAGQHRVRRAEHIRPPGPGRHLRRGHRRECAPPADESAGSREGDVPRAQARR